MIDERSCPRPEPDGADDRRTAEQRRADAFELILDQAALGASIDSIGSPRTQLMLTIPAAGADPATLPWTISVSDPSHASCLAVARVFHYRWDTPGGCFPPTRAKP